MEYECSIDGISLRFTIVDVGIIERQVCFSGLRGMEKN